MDFVIRKTSRMQSQTTLLAFEIPLLSAGVLNRKTASLACLSAPLTCVFSHIAMPGGDVDNYDRLLSYADSLGAEISRIVIAVCMENNLSLCNGFHISERDVRQERITLDHAPTFLARSIIWYTKSWLTYNSATYKVLTTAVHQTPWLKRLAVRADLVIPNLAGITKNTLANLLNAQRIG